MSSPCFSCSNFYQKSFVLFFFSRVISTCSVLSSNILPLVKEKSPTNEKNSKTIQSRKRASSDKSIHDHQKKFSLAAKKKQNDSDFFFVGVVEKKNKEIFGRCECDGIMTWEPVSAAIDWVEFHRWTDPTLQFRYHWTENSTGNLRPELVDPSHF